MATFNEAALARLLQSPDGPVGREVARRAEEIVTAARSNARIILHRLPDDTFADVAAAIDFEMSRTGDGEIAATIGIRDEGSISRYLSDKEAREGVVLRRAAEEVFGGGG